ncbi:MAG: DUF975 family protein [Clostridia bacterium]|nr:DUF975 family protein [Clostridia bacterium]
MKNSQIKILTKGIINGSVGKSSLFMLFALCTLIFFTALPVVAAYFIPNTIISIAVIFVSLAIYALARCAFRSGSGAWFRFYQRKNRTGRVLYWFSPKRALRSMGLYASIFFRKLFWTLILILPGALTVFSFCYLAYDSGIEFNLFLCGIVGGAVLTAVGLLFRFILVQRYFLAQNIFVSDPKIKASQAIRLSREIMNGKLKRTALFKLSFTPWILLCAGVLPAIYVWPYYRQNCALLAGEIKKEIKQTA